MAYKLTMIFQCTTVPVGTTSIPRTAGWSESVYSNIFAPSTRTSFRNLQIARANLLPVGAAIVGQRIQVVQPTGGSSTEGERFNGTFTDGNSGPQMDLPSMALLVKSSTGTANVRNTILRGLPDAVVQGGELVASTSFLSLLQLYFAQLRGWAMLGRNLTAPRVPIFNIEGDTLTFGDNTVLTVPGLIGISRAIDVHGLSRSATVKVTASLTSSTYTIQGWTFGDSTGGQVRDVTPAFRLITNSQAVRVIQRKVGRPLFVFRGRRSKRRKTA